MKRFMAVYTGTEALMEKWKALSEAQRQEREAVGMKAWMEWGETHKAAIVDMGAPLGKTKRTARDGVTDTRNNLAGYIVVQAESHQAAAKLFENHPHFTIFPGEAGEIMECLPLPAR